METKQTWGARKIVATDALRRAYRERPRSVTTDATAAAAGIPNRVQVQEYLYHWMRPTPLTLERLEKLGAFLGVPRGVPVFQEVDPKDVARRIEEMASPVPAASPAERRAQAERRAKVVEGR